MGPVKQRTIHNYTEEALASALHAIRNNTLGIREASRQFAVPRGTLQDRLHGRVKEGPRKMGPSTILSEGEEKRLVQWLIDVAKSGFPRKREELLNSVQKIVNETNRQTPFKDGRPGRKWYASFLKRHPELVHRTPESITKGRAVLTEESLRKWFRELQNFLEENNATSILEDPSRIFNGDETSFSLCPKSGMVIAPKGWKDVYEIKHGNEKETITVLLVFSASGKTLFPMVVYPYVRPPHEVIKSLPNDWFLGRSDSGWMKSDTFYEYIANGVNNWLENEKVTKPILLFVDGHKSHLTLHLSNYCERNGIFLYALPPNSTHIMQPADVSVFKPLKSDWKRTVREWIGRPENTNMVVTKATFAPLLATVLENPSLAESIKNGFRKCGLYPFDPNAVDYSKCVQNRLEALNRCEGDSAVTGLLKEEQVSTAQLVISALQTELSKKGINVCHVLEVLDNAKKLISTRQTSTSITNDNNTDNNLGDVSFDITNMEILYDFQPNGESHVMEMLEGEAKKVNDVLYTELNQPSTSSQQSTNDIALISQSEQPSILSMDERPETITDVLETSIPAELKNRNCSATVKRPTLPTPQPVRNNNDDQTTNDNSETVNRPTSPTPQSVRNNNDDQTTNDNSETVNRPTSPTPQSVRNNNDDQTTNDNSETNLVPSPFKKHLFYPKPIEMKSSKLKPLKERQPSAISSKMWREYAEKKERQKEEDLERKRKNKLEREEKKAEKEQTKKIKMGTSRQIKGQSKENESHEESCDESSGPSVEPRIWKFGRSFPHVRPIGIHEKILIDDWLLVSFKEEHGRRFFIGKVIGESEKNDEILGSFLRPKTTRDFPGLVYGFPDIVDEYPFDRKDIVGRLSDPESYGRGLLKFDISHKDIQ